MLTIPAGCISLRLKFLQEDYYCTGVLVDHVSVNSSAIEVDPDRYVRIPIKTGLLKENLSVERKRDYRGIQYDLQLSWDSMSKSMFDKLRVLHYSNEVLYFDDGEVPDQEEEFTIYENETQTYSGITNPSTTNIAYKDSGATLPTAYDDHEVVEFPTVGYQAIDADDSSYYETSDPADTYYLWYKFVLVSTITGSGVQRFRVKVVASSDDESPQNYDGCVLYAWNGSTWDEIARTTNDDINDIEYETTTPAVAQQYVDSSGNIYLLLRSRGARNGSSGLDLKAYYVEAEVNDGLSEVITPSHRPYLPNNYPHTDMTVENKTTGATLSYLTDYTYDVDTSALTIIGQSNGDVIRVQYLRLWQVEIVSLPERWNNGDVSSDRYRDVDMILTTLTGSI